MTGEPKRPAWAGWVFLIWAAIVLAVYVRQLLDNAAQLGIRLTP